MRDNKKRNDKLRLLGKILLEKAFLIIANIKEAQGRRFIEELFITKFSVISNSIV